MDLPTEINSGLRKAYEKAVCLAESHFVSVHGVTCSFTQWDDGDYTVRLYHGFECRRDDMHHGEEIYYKRSNGEFLYQNYTREFGWHEDRGFREYVIEEWTPESG